MKIQEKIETTIILTADDIKNIVKEYLETKGYKIKIDEIYPQISKTEYDDLLICHEYFDGFKIKANSSSETKTI